MVALSRLDQRKLATSGDQYACARELEAVEKQEQVAEILFGEWSFQLMRERGQHLLQTARTTVVKVSAFVTHAA